MTVQVPKRTLVTMMNSLSSGVVPRRGLEYIAVGRRKETETFVSDMEDTACGGGAFRFISGRFGNGKSFMTQMIRNNAIDKGFVVMDADLSINRRLTGSHKEGLNTYRELVRNVAIRTRPDGGAMESILQQWVDSSEGDIRKELRSMTSDMATMPHYRDFIKVVEAYCQDYLSEKDEIPALDWLKGEYDLKSDARKAFGVSSIITDDNWYDIIKLWAELFVRFGYKGLIVFLDEAVVLYKLQNLVGQLQQTKHIGHGRTALTSLLGDLLLLQTESFNERLVGHSLFNGIQILTLNVLDQRYLSDLQLVAGHDHSGNFVQTRHFCGSPTALARNDLVIFVHNTQLAHDNGLNHAMLADGISQHLQGVIVKILTGLIAARGNTADFDGSFGFCLGFGHVIVDQRVEITSQAFILRHFFSPP